MSITSNKQLKAFYNQRIQEYLKIAAVEPRCPYFGECGGCAMQNLSYESQLQLKSELIQEIFADQVAEFSNWEIVASPNEYDYRLRMDYVVSHDPFHAPNARLGLRKRKQFNHVIDLSECHLISPSWFAKVRKIYKLAGELNLPNYDLVSNKGYLRYLVIRVYAEQAMLNIITKSDEYAEKIGKLASAALESGFTSVHWLIQPEVSDISFGESIKYWGDKELLVPFRIEGKDVNFKTGPNNFFQNNVDGFNLILETIAGYLKSQGKLGKLYDLYCGVGTMGICLANYFDRVEGTELVAESIELAKQNATLNDVSNISFEVGDVSKLITGEKFADSQSSTVIVDPPRAGLTRDGVDIINQLSPARLIYVSCNPITQAQDLAGLLPNYKVVLHKTFDLFPQTYHLENLVIMERRIDNVDKQI